MKKREIIAVGGGKGGVGKTLVSVNLALALTKLGKSVVLFDGDLGSANCHTLLGITRVEKSLEEYFKEELRLDSLAVPTRFPQLSLICGASGKVDAYLSKPFIMERLIREILQLEYDYIVIDLGAGIGDDTLDLYNLSHEKVIVVTPQFTSLQNAYSFAKSAFLRSLSQQESLTEFLSKMPDPVVFRKFMLELPSHDAVRRDYESVVRDQKFRLLGNMMSGKEQLAIIKRVREVIKEFLDIDSAELGFFTQTADVQSSINKITPFLELFPDDPNSREMMRVAGVLEGKPPAAPPRAWWKIWQEITG
ncbi:P-loop NTPase [Bdellovibrionota bacterium FG-1]